MALIVIIKILTTRTLCLYLLRCRIPCSRASSKIRFIGQVARQRRVVAKYCILGHRLPGLNRLKESPQMRLFLIPGYAFVAKALECRLFTRRRVGVLMPVLDISLAHLPRIAAYVVTRRGVFACLRHIVN